ncbi:MAG: 50S ribosomal protein L9 [Pseudomonadota bacterium]|nr:50S ribosomal protein L9 [Pseudomonadota bacterium]
MKVILLETIANLGGIGDVVTVKAGFGRNYLFPQGKAMMATEANLAEVEKRRAELEAQHAADVAAAQERADKLNGQSIQIEANAGDEGKLFGSIGTREIAEAATTQLAVEVEKSEVLMPEGPLRNTGEFEIDLQLHSEVAAQITVNIVPEA